MLSMIHSVRMKTKPVLLSLTVLALSACVMHKEPPPARSIEYGTYSCDGSRQFVADFQPDDSVVSILYNKRSYLLERDASGVFYGSAFALSGPKEGPVTVTRDGIAILTNCAPVTTQPQYYQKKYQFRNFDASRDLK